MPEHRLPTLGQRKERPGDELPLQLLQGGVHERLPRGNALHVFGHHVALVAPAPVVGGVTDRGQQVGAEGALRSSPTSNDAEDTGERLRYGVLRLGLTVQQLAGQPTRGGGVTLVQGGVGTCVARTDTLDEL